MTTNDFARLRGAIESELAILDHSISDIKSELRSSSEVNANAFQDPLDCAKGETDLCTRVEIHNHASTKRNGLRAALVRFERGSFGLCVACQEEIDHRRLKAQPEAILCLSCQEFKETGTSHVFHYQPIHKLSNKHQMSDQKVAA
jgi:DnaK suppressor protein